MKRSVIGFAFAFGQVLQADFMAGGQCVQHASPHGAQIAFVGPQLGRPDLPVGKSPYEHRCDSRPSMINASAIAW